MIVRRLCVGRTLRASSAGLFTASRAVDNADFSSKKRLLSAAYTVHEPPKVGRFARRRAQKHLLNRQKAHENDSELSRVKEKPKKPSKLVIFNCVVQQQMPLEDVLPLVQHEVRTKTLRAPMARQAVDAFYFYCAQQAESRDFTDELRRRVLGYFEKELFTYDPEQATTPFVLGKTLNEAVFSSVIKLYVAGGDTDAAWTLLTRLRQVRKGQKDAQKLHFRTIGPLLEHECKHGQYLRAFSRWQDLKKHDVEWTSAMEDVLVQMIIACVNDQEPPRTTKQTTASQFHEHMTSLLHDLQLACREVSSLNAQRLLHAFRGAGYTVETVPSDSRMLPTCPSCGHALSKQGMSAPERQQMLLAIESHRSRVAPDKVVSEFLHPFKDWLLLRHESFRLHTSRVQRKHLMHYVLDGPNIAYINQNFDAGTYRLDHVDAVAKQLQAQGHYVSITMPAMYLADKFVVRVRKKSAQGQQKISSRIRTEEENAILARWRHDNMIFSCRTDFLSDDLFWLYASVLMANEGRVVSNDQGRDHVLALLNGDTNRLANARSQTNGKKSVAQAAGEQSGVPLISMDLIARWKDMTAVHVEIKHDESADPATTVLPIETIKLHHPLPFSRVPQVTTQQHFHFPITEHANQNEHPNQVRTGRKRTQWLCAHQKVT
ncbi:uncharacterized protein CCR75_007816 [Bremia lactucae]|uniref:Uncharacterized protein n=1 Tax=Bremia lactucae TaxID=4779 RepID=A0A976P0K3_BRELC|nr:hypothetical protein CCR75_007816 [Bremia lactucae]